MDDSHKQLPLRPTRDKPILKYSSGAGTITNQHNSTASQPTSNIGTSAANYNSGGYGNRPPAVPLFSQSDLQTYKQQVYNNFVNNYNPVYHSPLNASAMYPRGSAFNPTATGLYSTSGPSPTGMYSTGATNAYHAPVPQLSLSNYTYLSGPGTPSGHSVTAAQILSSNVPIAEYPATNSTAAVAAKSPTKNPYARPISAKDVEPPSNNPIPHAVLSKNAINAVSLGMKSSNGSTSSLSSVGSTGTNQGSVVMNGKIQTNVFMRPVSAMQRNSDNTNYKADINANVSKSNTVQGSAADIVTNNKDVMVEKPPSGFSVRSNSLIETSPGNHQPYHHHQSSNTAVNHHNRTIQNGSSENSSSSQLSLKPTVTRPPSGRKPGGGVLTGTAVVNHQHSAVNHNGGIHSAPPTRPSSATRHNNNKGGIVRNASSGALVSQGQSQINNVNNTNSGTGGAKGLMITNSGNTKNNSQQNSSGYLNGKAVSLNSNTVKEAFVANAPTTQQKIGTNSGKDTALKNRFQPREKRPGSSDSTRSIRNPQYTPNKPYQEVSDSGTSAESSRNSSASSVRTVYNNMEIGPPRKTTTVQGGEKDVNNISDNKQSGNKADTKTSSTSLTRSASFPSQKGVEINPKLLLDGTVKEMPVTHTLTGTIYYRKSSKAEETLPAKQVSRTVPEGAPATTTTKKEFSSPSPSKKKSVEWAQNVSYSSSPDKDGGEWTDYEEDEEDDGITMKIDSRGERLPGDGEADVDNQDDDDGYEDGFDDEDDDIIDNIEDDDGGESDDESDACISNLTPSRKNSATALRLKSATKRLLGLQLAEPKKTKSTTSTGSVRSRPPTTGGSVRGRPLSAVSTLSSDSDIQSALMPSLFPNIPPTINFVTDGEKVEQLPWEIRKLLKWKMSPITPNVVKNCIARSGFRATNRNHDWIGYWGKHMKAQGFKTIREYQKVNHFPGSFQIGRKDRLWRNLSKMQVHFGKKEFGFFPQTFVLPFDLKQLKRSWEDGGNKQKWIIKPPASARGIGIKVINKWNQIPKKRAVIVQRYLAKPYLINESKFDIRLYVYVTSYDPLRIYLFDDGLVRFASVKYSHSMKSINNRYMHLTNYSINKKNTEYQSNTDENVCQGHKWGLKALWGYMKQRGINTNAVWENIKDLVIKTVMVSEPYVNPLMKANVKQKYICHELFGFDVMLDDTLKPWIIEVNISPSLHSNSQLDMNIKGTMIKDLFNLAGFMIPDKNDLRENPVHEPGKYEVPNEVCIDKRLWPSQMASDERNKHAYYCQRHNDEFVQATIMDTLTPDDVRILTETIDEDSRKGSFQRIFPSTSSHKYLRFFESPRYCNLLVDAWVNKYNRMEARGIAMLESMCSKGLHLQNPTVEPKHQWAPPNMSLPRDSRVLSAPASAKAGTRVFPNLKRAKPHNSTGTAINSNTSGSQSSTTSSTQRAPVPPSYPSSNSSSTSTNNRSYDPH